MSAAIVHVPRVLVVDDEATIRDIVVRYLTADRSRPASSGVGAGCVLVAATFRNL